ncbi:MAG: ABC transporter substrate-binding protein [Actinomycetota bacterium]
MRRFLASPVVATLVVVVAASACGRGSPGPAATGAVHTSAGVPTPSASPQFPLTIADDDGVEVTLDSAPTRIVTFAPSATEVVFALGLGDEVVGVSGRFDDYPPAARTITEVGGAGEFGVDPNVEKVVSLNPDIVLTIEGGDQWKTRLRGLGIPVFTTNSTDLDDLLHDIVTVGKVTGATTEAERLVGRMRGASNAVQQAVAAEPPVTCFFEVSFQPLYTVGPGSFIYDLLQRAGCDPVTADAKDAYPQWSVEELVRDDPDVYLVSSESGGTVSQVERRPGYDALSAVRDHRVYLVSSDLVSRAGPRVIAGLRALAHALHPDAAGM